MAWLQPIMEVWEQSPSGVQRQRVVTPLKHFLTSNGAVPFLCFVVIVFSRGFHKTAYRSVSIVAEQMPSIHILQSISFGSKSKSMKYLREGKRFNYCM